MDSLQHASFLQKKRLVILYISHCCIKAFRTNTTIQCCYRGVSMPQSSYVWNFPKNCDVTKICVLAAFPDLDLYHMVATLLSILATFAKMADKSKERTFIMVKPDGVQRGLVGEIMKRFESRGYKLVACKMCRVRNCKCRHCSINKYFFQDAGTRADLTCH